MFYVIIIIIFFCFIPYTIFHILISAKKNFCPALALSGMISVVFILVVCFVFFPSVIVPKKSLSPPLIFQQAAAISENLELLFATSFIVCKRLSNFSSGSFSRPGLLVIAIAVVVTYGSR